MAAALILGFVALHQSMTHRVLEKLQGWRLHTYATTIQNRSGIIAIEKAQPSDVVYGGGMYDGRFNIDPDVTINGIDRAYAMAILHPKPTRLLEIGLSSGSWARVIADYEHVQKMTIVEINPGYLEVIPRYPTHKPLLHDPDIEIVIDDGRRWLNRNPDRRFEFILMNATWHWRSHSSSVLSQQFAHLMRAHLAPGGVAYWNTTHSQAVVDTAASVFKHVVQYGNFVAASDAPLTLSRQQRSANLQRFKRDGASVLNPTGKGSQLYRHLLHIGLPELGPNSRRRVRPGGVITDDNMLVEYKNLKRRPIGISAWTDLTRTRPVQARRAWWPTLRRVFRF